MSLLEKFKQLVQKPKPATPPQPPYPYTIRFPLNGRTFLFWIADDTGAQWYSRPEDWQAAAEPRELAALVRPGDRVLEIGCHHGLLTLMLADAVGPHGFVLAVEAHPRTALVAQAQVTLNRLGNVCHVAHLAVSDHAGTLTFCDASCSAVAGTAAEGGIRVEAVTGDTLLEQYGPFDLVKIDVEGFEGQVLQGCPRLLAARPRLALELHQAYLAQYESSTKEIVELLESYGYEGTVMLRDFLTVVPFDPRNLPEDEIINLFLHPRGSGP